MLTSSTSKGPVATARGSVTWIISTSITIMHRWDTWLHGDARGSVDRFHRGYDTPKLPPNSGRKRYEEALLKQRAVILDSPQRAAIESGVRETCMIRRWSLWALNVRNKSCSCSRLGQSQA